MDMLYVGTAKFAYIVLWFVGVGTWFTHQNDSIKGQNPFFKDRGTKEHLSFPPLFTRCQESPFLPKSRSPHFYFFSHFATYNYARSLDRTERILSKVNLFLGNMECGCRCQVW